MADLIRLDVVAKFGGVYLDSDFHLVRPLTPIADHCRFFVCSEDGRLATNALFGAEPGHPAVEAMIAELSANPPNWSAPPNETTGPELFSRMLKWRSDVTLLPRAAFYPYNWDEDARPPERQTYGVHQWAGSWTTKKKKKSLGRWWRSQVAAARASRKLDERFIRKSTSRLEGYSCAGELLRRTAHGQFILLAGEDLSITPELYSNGFYELKEELFLKRILRGGDFFVDVGANIGNFSLLAAAKVGPFGRVFAYEPNPYVLNMLARSAMLNWMHERIILRDVAIGEASGAARLKFAAARLGDAALSKEGVRSAVAERSIGAAGDAQEIEVKVVTLDEEFPFDLPIRAMKIDAEGFEPQVLAGANRLLRAGCIDFLMIEVVEEVSGEGWRPLIRSLENLCEMGYEPHTFGRNGAIAPIQMERIVRGGGSRFRNVVFKHRDALES